jgi:ParB/RepB/Spo0J family partition protein
MLISIEKILPNPEQPRKYFDLVELTGLAQSIGEHGVIEPLVLEEASKGMYIIHDGERRWRAAKMAGLAEVPAVVVPPLNGTGPQERLVRALVANIQRADLGPVEEGQAFARLREMGLSINRIAITLGTNIKRVSDGLSLMELEKPIQELIEKKTLSKDNRLVKALLEVPAGKVRIELAKKLAERHVTVAAGMAACLKVWGALEAGKLGADEVPGIELAVRKSGKLDRPVWDAMAQVGRVPPWVLVEISARETCNGCSLRDQASEMICKDCPLVVMLVRLMGKKP